MIAGSWRAALAAAPRTHVVANADDPLVVWGAGAARDVHWVGAGLRWQHDAVGCPSCEGRIEFGPSSGWSCASCGFSRPDPEATLVVAAGRRGPRRVGRRPRRSPVRLSLPGRFNQSNALMAAVAAEACGVDALEALAAMEDVEEVAGRFTVRVVRRRARPGSCWPRTRRAGASCSTWWPAPDAPLVVSINARTADGADPSWLWDVPYERLAGRAVVATGDRFRDLSVRLHYGGVTHTTEPDPVRRRDPRRRRRPGRRWSTSSGTTRRSTTCWARRDDGAAAHRGRLPRPARHLRRRRERPGAGPAGRMARLRRRAAAGPLRPPPPRSRRLLPGRGRGRAPGPRGADARRRGHAGPARRGEAPWCWRSARDSRSSGGPFPAPTATRTRGSGSSTSRR